MQIHEHVHAYIHVRRHVTHVCAFNLPDLHSHWPLSESVRKQFGLHLHQLQERGEKYNPTVSKVCMHAH